MEDYEILSSRPERLCAVQFGADARLLLGSDGLVVTATDEEMYEAVGRGDTPEESLEHLLELSKQRGAPDNVTAVLLYHE